MKDLISRKAVIESIDEYFDDLPLQVYYELVKMFENLPAIEPKRGKWETEVRTIRGHKIPFFACSVCGRNADDEYPYCPNCGAKMGGDIKHSE